MMFLTKKLSNVKNIYYKIIIILSYIFTWTSIGTHYSDLFILTQNESITLKEVIQFFRTTLNLLCFPILWFMFFMSALKYKDNYTSISLTFFIPLLCFLSQVPGLFYTANSLWNFLYILSSINILIILNLIILHFKKDEIYFIIFITFIMMLVVFFISFTNDLIQYLKGKGGFYGGITYFFSESSGIRSSGTSRISLILLITYSIFSTKFIKSKILRITPLVFFISTIILYQSRLVIIITLIFIILNFIKREKYTLISLFKYLLIHIVIPITLTFLILSTKNVKEQILIIKNCKNTECHTKYKSNNHELRFNVEGNEFLSTTGRTADWKEIFNRYNYDNNLFFGYGVQGDRYLINQSASNGLIYAFVSSGFIGIMFFLIITITSGMQVLTYLFFNKEKRLTSYFVFIMLVFLIRSLAESSYSVFSVDLILFYTSFIFMQKYRHII